MTSPKLRQLERQMGLKRQTAAPDADTSGLAAEIDRLVQAAVTKALASHQPNHDLEQALARSLATTQELQKQAMARPLEPAPAPSPPIIRPLYVVSPRRERLPIPQAPAMLEPMLPTLPAPMPPRRLPMEMTMLRDGLGTLLGVQYKDVDGNELLTATVIQRDEEQRIVKVGYKRAGQSVGDMQVTKRNEFGDIVSAKMVPAYDMVE